MKHTPSVTYIVLAVFLISQFIGLFIVDKYIDQAQLKEGKIVFSNLPLDFERPQLDEGTSFIYIMVALILGTLLALLLIRFRQINLWKVWFTIAIFTTLTVAFKPFISETLAWIAALILTLWKVWKPNFYVQNFTELFIYGGLAAIFVPVLSVFSVSMLLVLISIYDAYAVWKSKHMIKLAKFQTESKMFAGVIIPYQLPKFRAPKGPVKKIKVRTAILGGGDIGFPLMFAGVLFRDLLLNNTASIAFAKVLIVPVLATASLGMLLYYAQKDKFYPAMPFISAGCFIALALMKLFLFI